MDGNEHRKQMANRDLYAKVFENLVVHGITWQIGRKISQGQFDHVIDDGKKKEASSGAAAK